MTHHTEDQAGQDDKPETQGSQPHQSAAQAPGDTQVTDPTRMLGDHDEVNEQSE